MLVTNHGFLHHAPTKHSNMAQKIAYHHKLIVGGASVQCKNKCVILAKYLVTTIVWLSFYILCNFMNAVIKRIHAVEADTWINFTPSHKIFYKDYILWISIGR